MKKKNGFTLVELLAVVVILAVVSIITIPIIVNLINAAQKGALKDSATGLLKSADLYYSIHKMQDKEFEDTTFSVENGAFTSEKKLDYKGQVKNAYLRVFPDGEMAICVDDGQYSIVKSVEQNIKDVEPTESICTGEFDDATMSYATSGSHNYGEILLNVKAFSSIENLPAKASGNDIAVITSNKITGYYAGYKEPQEKKEGMIWLVSKIVTGTDIMSAKTSMPLNYALQYIDDEWIIKDSYIYTVEESDWERLEFYDKSDFVYNYSYTGKYEKFTAAHTGTYQIELWGASGGTNNGSYPAGLGAYVKGDIYLEEGEELYVYVGGAGSGSGGGGWNGGGSGYSGGGGGGATDIRLVQTSAANVWNTFDSLKSRIMVAGAGGGAANHDSSAWRSRAGNGGALSGGRGLGMGSQLNSQYLGSGGTQTSGGVSPYHSSTAGGFGYGGNQVSSNWNIGGGGSGYYGGGGGYYAGASGGGGSSFISGYEGCNAIDTVLSESASQLIITNQPVHTSGKQFSNGLMDPGKNSGNGRATITFKAFGEYNPVKKQMKPGDAVIYNYSGCYEAFHVNTTGTYTIELWGASGGTNDGSYPPGKGGYTKGDIYLKSGTTLYVFVGGQGNSYSSGGYNGGGDGFNGGGGGGATDIRVNVIGGDWNTFNNLKNRIMVAAGGGGGTNHDSGSWRGPGGDGGGTVGQSGDSTSVAGGGGISYCGSGGTQTSPGIATASSSTVGGFGYGGNQVSSNWNIAGGGGGWYGGGGGYYAGGAGGGGSSYISGHNGCNAVRDNSTAGNIIHLGVSEHFSKFVFKNTVMQTGVNAGDGRAIITLKSKDENTEKYELKDVYTFEYDGAYVPFTIPRTGYYQIELWGAQGSTNDGSYPGGLGGYTSGKIYLEKGQKFFVYVGGQATGKAGGANGGGSAGVDGAGGGGATDIRTIAGTGNNVQSWASRIMVAAGGGGGANHDSSSWRSNGGAGGGLTGYSGVKIGSSITVGSHAGTGGTQTAGGSSSAGTGAFGYGSNSNSTTGGYRAGGGGGGWFGGAGGYYAGGAGGGGSSYISGHAGCIGVSKTGSLNASSYSSISDSYSNTGFKFTDTVMIDGQGYEWTTTKGSYVGMPQYDGVQTMTGNSGNGFAKFTYLGK